MTTIVQFHDSDDTIRKQVHDFCGALILLKRWDTPVLVPALTLLSALSEPVDEVMWIYEVLEHIHEAAAAGHSTWMQSDAAVYLLRGLAKPHILPRPSHTVLGFILTALSTGKNTSREGFRILCRHAETWFPDATLTPILRQYPIWPLMGRIALGNPHGLGREYLEMGDVLSRIVEWESDIRSDPASWFIMCFQHYKWWHLPWTLQAPYTAVLSRIWKIKHWETYQFEDGPGQALGHTLIALSHVWKGFDFAGHQVIIEFARLARCTTTIAFRATYTCSREWNISPEFRVVFIHPLGKTLIQAATVAREVAGEGPEDAQEFTSFLNKVADILEEMGTSLGGNHKRRVLKAEKRYWTGLRRYFHVKIDALTAELGDNIDHPNTRARMKDYGSEKDAVDGSGEEEDESESEAF
ncbi:hypothetical protein B0H11DRAFT_1927672 [Mycena galericulata]|nr:hypothetical protein B0H11DRAFT_1927672 [Mycena galericulata]